MSLLKAIPWFFPLVMTVFSAQSLAEGFDSEYDAKPWAEIEVQLPDFPEKENLIPFSVGAVRDKKFLIDANSLSVGADGVVRYTLIVLSSTGAQNISYEGLRCDTAERRPYAFGRSDKTWSKARNNQWLKIHGSFDNHYVELYTNYFCAVAATPVTSADDARRVLRSGGQPAPANH